MCCKMKKSVIPILPLLLLLALPAGNGLWGQIENDRSSSPYFQVNCADEKTGQLPLMATSARVNIAGVIADVQVTQRYRNAGEKPIEAIYVFPASTRAAVYGMKMTIGSRVVTAKIEEKEKARHQYEQALEDGRRASLLEQDRPNVFRMNVGNILPGDTIEVLLQYTEYLVPESGVYRFVYPAVVGPRYTGGKTADGQGDRAYTAVPYQHQGEAPSYDFNLQVSLSGGMPLSDIRSSSHNISVDNPGNGTAEISLDPAERKGGNRDFILDYRMAGNQIQTGMLTFDDGKEKFFLFMAQPPKSVGKTDIPPREYIFVVDVSGSMTGFPLEVSKTLLRDLVAGLTPSDRFNILLFAGGNTLMSENSLPATPENVEAAFKVLDNENGGGGTELLPALKRALALPRNDEGLSRSVVLITDGYISVEAEAFDLVRKNLDQSNLFAFGIGSSVNRFLIEGLARAGRSEPFIVTDQTEAPPIAKKFRQYIGSPVLTQVKVDFGQMQVYDQEPLSVPDVLAERPVVIFGKYKGNTDGTVKLTGFTGANKKYSYKFKLKDAVSGDQNAALRYLWARDRIKTLDDYNQSDYDIQRIAEVTRLGLQYNLLTAYTSFVAVDEEIAVKDGEKAVPVKQPLPMPEGVSDYAVGFSPGFSGVAFAGASRHLFKGLFNFSNMKPVHRISLIIGLIALVLIIGLQVRNSRSKNQNNPAVAMPGATADRPQITFVLGEDETAENPYYRNAMAYCRQNEGQMGGQIVQSCRSLLEVRDYLEKNAPSGRPWGKVSLIVHGNEWTGLAIPVATGGPRATEMEINQAMQSKTFPELSDRIVDRHSEVVVYACGLGRNTAILHSLARLLGGADAQRPVIRASKYFNLYEPVASDPSTIRQSSADYWYVYYPSGKRPGKEELLARFENQFPDEDLDWEDVLLRFNPRWPGDTYCYRVPVPIQWTVVYRQPADLPDLKSPAAQKTWLGSQTELMDVLHEMGVEPGEVNWQFHRRQYQEEDGAQWPAVVAEGKTTAFCVLKPLVTAEEDALVSVYPETK